MSNPFKKVPEVRAAQLAEQALADVAEAEGLTNEEFAQMKPPTTPSAKPTAKPVKTVSEGEIDFEDLDETTLLKYNIVAKSLNESAMVTLKPVDSSKALRWCYYNNGIVMSNKDKVTAINVGRYKNWGFEFATVNDIQGGEDALVEGIVEDGGKILNYDTVLMKVDKIRLMGHYKKNLLQSLDKVDNSLGRAIKGAEGDVQTSPGYQKARATHPQAKIEFYSPAE